MQGSQVKSSENQTKSLLGVWETVMVRTRALTKEKVGKGYNDHLQIFQRRYRLTVFLKTWKQRVGDTGKSALVM